MPLCVCSGIFIARKHFLEAIFKDIPSHKEKKNIITNLLLIYIIIDIQSFKFDLVIVGAVNL